MGKIYENLPTKSVSVNQLKQQQVLPNKKKHRWDSADEIVITLGLNFCDGGCINNSDFHHQKYPKTQIVILPYGSVSKPCTPGEHQNSW